MKYALLIGLIAPLACALLRLYTGKYLFNVGLTGGCALLLLLSGDARLWPVAAALGLSIAGDFCMAHKAAFPNAYLCGVALFFCAHAAFLCYIAQRLTLTAAVALVGAALFLFYGGYAVKRLLPNVPGAPMKAAVLSYAAISCAALALSFGLDAPLAEKLPFVFGIAMIVFSDACIAEADFGGRRGAAPLILPTYFACHLLVTASALLRA